ncbi:MAG: hypothetical protein CFE45_28120 [Burkholderiales bacterium PBB5]|nr:MAG: hypothetical protein CFE45_28120 [Burkholderiales bacterium PBB5]
MPLAQAGAGVLWVAVAGAVQAAPIGAMLDPPAPRAEPTPGGQVLERALSGDVGSTGLPSSLPLELRRDSGPAAVARSESAASAARLPPATRVAPVVAPAAATAQVPSLLGGQLAGTQNDAVVRPEAPKLSRDWNGGAPGTGGGAAAGGGYSGLSTEPGAVSPRTAAGAAPAFGPLLWLSQGLAFIRENRMGLLAGVGGLALVWMVQQARGRRRRA